MQELFVLGSIASVLALLLALPSAYISWQSANRAKSSAKKAQSIANHIFSSELSELETELKTALRHTRKYVSGSLAGAELNTDADAAIRFSGVLAEYQNNYNLSDGTNPARHLGNDLSRLFDQFRGTDDITAKQRLLAQVHEALQQFLTVSKEVRNNVAQ